MELDFYYPVCNALTFAMIKYFTDMKRAIIFSLGDFAIGTVCSFIKINGLKEEIKTNTEIQYLKMESN